MLKDYTVESLFNKDAQDHNIVKEFEHHSIRVMYLSCMLAKRLDIYDEDMKIAALLHDIGKIGLSRDILVKTERLTSLEKIILESHSHVGNVIVRRELERPRAAEFVRDHHENWDGTGYPRGLVGEVISIQGRVLRICDSFDAMTYDIRSYNITKMAREEAFKELRRYAWRHYDGDILETFISLIEEIDLSATWYDDGNLNELVDQIK